MDNTESYGVNLLPEKEHQGYDMYCPIADDSPEGTLNYYKESCKYRQKNSKEVVTCYGGCKAKKYKGKILKEREDSKKANVDVDKSHMSWEEIDRLNKCFEAGLEPKVIAEQFNRSIQTIRLRKQKWEKGVEDGNLGRARVKKLYELLDKGLTHEETATIIKCSRNTVGNYARKRKRYENL